MQKTINVTEDDIKNGMPHSCFCCPVALALRRELSVETVEVCEEIAVYSGEFSGTYAMDDEVVEFIMNFDEQEQRHMAAPFSFVLDTEDQVVDEIEDYDDEDDYEDDDDYDDAWDDEDDDEDWDDED